MSNGSLLGVYRKAHDSSDEAVAFFNFGAAATPFAIPVSSGHSWVKLADSATARFGGSGTGLLPDRIEDGGTLTIAPTGFCVYGA